MAAVKIAQLRALHSPAIYCCPALPVPTCGEFERSFVGLRQRISNAEHLLTELDPSAFEGGLARTIHAEAGRATHAMSASEYLLHYASPNFIFHMTTAFAILGHVGVSVGKADFDGYHCCER